MGPREGDPNITSLAIICTHTGINVDFIGTCIVCVFTRRVSPRLDTPPSWPPQPLLPKYSHLPSTPTQAFEFLRSSASPNFSKVHVSGSSTRYIQSFLTRVALKRVGALTRATYSLSGCGVLPATDESGVTYPSKLSLDDVACQHSATIILRKYVKEHWSPFFQQFRGDAPPPEVSSPFVLCLVGLP